MGIDFATAVRLAELAGRFRPEGRSVMLGRQALRPLRPAPARRVDAQLAEIGVAEGFEALSQEDGFSERFFDRIGLGPIETLDASDYEGASIVHDLNEPVPDALKGQFGFIFDGGTIEHVFDVPRALRNVFEMLRPGGRFVSANGMNNWLSHGLYQFGPELAWTFWRRMAGCTVHRCEAAPEAFPSRPFPLPDPAETGRRLRLRGKLPEGRVYLYYEIERPAGASLSGRALQSDYVARWAEASERVGA